EPVLPELVPAFTLPQGPPDAPTGTLWDHTLRVVELLGVPNPPAPFPGREGGEKPPPRSGEGVAVSFPLAFAALLHDVGKPRVFGRTADRYTFHGHEHIGKGMAEAVADRL